MDITYRHQNVYDTEANLLTTGLRLRSHLTDHDEF